MDADISEDVLDRARAFVADQHRAVLITRRRDGGLQTSPVAAGLDAAGRIVVSTPSRTAKARNAVRDRRVSLCVVPDSWFGPWLHVDAEAEVVGLPEALPLLEDYYRSISGEHPDWGEYRDAMRSEDRVVLRLTLTHAAGPALDRPSPLSVSQRDVP